jgi:hypothetical protein
MEIMSQVRPHLVLDSTRESPPIFKQSLILLKYNRSGHGKSDAIEIEFGAVYRQTLKILLLSLEPGLRSLGLPQT